VRNSGCCAVWKAAGVQRENALPDGAYERLVTKDLLHRLDGLRVARQPVEEVESAGRLGQHVGALAERYLATLPAAERVAGANRILAAMEVTDEVSSGPEQLLAVAREEAPGVWRLLETRPQVPLSQPALLTNSHNDPKLGAELRAELATADRVDLLCAFVKWYGVRVLEAELPTARLVAYRCASSRRPTWARPTAQRSTASSATSAPTSG
jgi:hypothetical protein